MQRAIPSIFMRGGTSRGPFFRASDLPADTATRDRVLLAVMGSPDPRQIDGLGGADPLTSKVGIVRLGSKPDVDLEFLFAQVAVKEALVDTTPNCGNMLAAVVPFAIESGLIAARGDVTTLRVLTENTGTLSDIEVHTPGGRVEYAGDARIDGVPGTAAPVNIRFLDTAGSVCGALLPTGNLVDRFDGVDVTCIDNGMPVVIMAAQDLGVTGHESRDALNANIGLKQRIESIRLQAGPAMKLGDVAKKVVPKMCLVAPPTGDGHLTTRTFIPHRVHESIGVLGAVSVATACMVPGSVAAQLAQLSGNSATQRVDVEHPTGFFTVDMEVAVESGKVNVRRSALLRTARKLMSGEVFVPGTIWSGR